MALVKRFPIFDQALVRVGSWITHQVWDMAYRALPYLYEAIGDIAAPPVGGPAKEIAGHDHSDLYYGAFLSRGGTCFAFGGRSALFDIPLDANTKKPVQLDWEAVVSDPPFFGWSMSTDCLGSVKVAYASPGIHTKTAINTNNYPVYQDLRIRYYWPPSANTAIRFIVVCRDATLDQTRFFPKESDKRYTTSTSPDLSPPLTAMQQEVVLRVPVRGDWWNSIDIYVEPCGTLSAAFTLKIYDVCMAETYGLSQPASKGRSRFQP